MAEKKYDVFLSYSFQDRDWVSVFSEALKDAGLTTWFDAANISLGDSLVAQIQRALRESKTLIMILSPNSLESTWTFFELGAAVADDKRIIPVLTQETDIKDVPVLLQQFQFLKGSSPSEAGRRVAEVITQTH